LGYQAGNNATGQRNTFVGAQAGTSITSGASNTLIGRFGGNSGGLNITTSSNYIVLSDGDGNPRGYFDNNGVYIIKSSGTNLRLSTTFGSESFSIDAAPTTITLTNGATADVSASGSFSGYVMMNETTATGQLAMYVAGSGTVNIFGQVGGSFTNTSGSGSYRFYHAGGGVFRLSNQSGSTATFGIITFRTRNSG
jgi:hypothetical protein